MFGFGRADKRRAVMAEVAGRLPGELAAAHPVEKAAALVIANSLLGLAARLHGEGLADDPPGAGEKAASAALGDLLPALSGLVALSGDFQHPHRRFVLCHRRAAELAALTLWTAVDGGARAPAGQSWKAAWDGRDRVAEAVVWLRRYEVAAGVDAVPPRGDGEKPSDVDLINAGRTVPTFLRRKP